MSAPLLSVIVPTRERPEMLLRCLEALAAQTYAPFEVIVIYDASPDHTPQAVAEFASRHPQLRLTSLRNTRQLGANGSRWRGIRASRGQLLAFEDDDCIADPRWLSELARGFVSERVGAVTGIVEDPDPKNVYDLAFRGTHRVYGREQATRLVSGNMCVRRELLEGALDDDPSEIGPDMSASGRTDEEDLFLKLKARGFEVRLVPDAKVLHVHHYTRRSFYSQAFRGGRATAKLGFKYALPPRIELVCLAMGYVFLIFVPLTPWSLLGSAGSFGLFAAGALVYNELVRKNKTIAETLRSTPVMIAYYHLRAAGYFFQYARLLAGLDRVERVDLRAFKHDPSVQESR